MKTFETLYGKKPGFVSMTNGRVNLIGEHTDYNGGFVLPTCIPQKTLIQISPRDGQKVSVASTRSTTEDQSITVSNYLLGAEKKENLWTDYVQGTTAILARNGHSLSGFEAFIQSDVPVGSGLSSSAALVVGFIKALNQVFNWRLQETAIALLAQKVENEFVGANVGIMDQMIVSHGTIGDALFIDTASLDFRKVHLPTAKMELLVISSGVSHSNAHGGYNERRSQCEEACHLLNVKQLRDLGTADLQRVNGLPDPLGRRARHVITENERVLNAVRAIEYGDIELLGRLFKESHLSMKDDYEVSVREVDLLVQLCCDHPEVYGARLTGGGFGGSIVAVVEPGAAERVGQAVKEKYDRVSGRTAQILVPEGANKISSYLKVGQDFER